MIRKLILWLATRLLAKYVSGPLAGQIVEAASAAFDEIKAKGDDAVAADGKGAKPRIVLRPHDPGAVPVTIEDIQRGNPA